MKQIFKLALLLAVSLGLGLGSPGMLSAAEKSRHAGKKVEKSATKSAQKRTVAKASAGKAAKSAAKSAKQKTANKSTRQKTAVAGKSGKVSRVAALTPRKQVRQTIPDFDPNHLALYSSSALVIDQTSGQALIQKQPDAVLPIASITKLMTAMVVLDAKLDLHEVISIDDEDVDGLKGTRSRLPVGTTMTRETAMLLALMSSENRAAHSLARNYPGGMRAFVRAMNEKSAALGMFSTRFDEPTGLSSNNVSTAHDLARMVSAAARYPEIRIFSTTAEAKVELNGRIQSFGTTNPLVRSDNWEIGLSKTGYISEAGRCLVMQARVADKPVVIVLLDSDGKMTRVGDANRIKRWMESAGLVLERRTI